MGASLTRQRRVKEEAHEEQSEIKETESVLPNSWKVEQFVIAGFDKDGPGDFGRQVSLSNEEQAELLHLLGISYYLMPELI